MYAETSRQVVPCEMYQLEFSRHSPVIQLARKATGLNSAPKCNTSWVLTVTCRCVLPRLQFSHPNWVIFKTRSRHTFCDCGLWVSWVVLHYSSSHLLNQWNSCETSFCIFSWPLSSLGLNHSMTAATYHIIKWVSDDWPDNTINTVMCPMQADSCYIYKADTDVVN